MNPFDGSYASNLKGRLAAVRYRGGYNSGATPTCDTVFTEMYSYGTPGNITKKRVRVKRGSLNNMDLDSTYAYDTEGRNTAIQYPSSWNGSSWAAGPNLGTEFDNQGRLKKLKNLTTSTDIISGTTYNAMGEMLTMTGNGGAPSETRTYNSIGQMTRLQTGGIDNYYNFSATVNNGKITSENDAVSGETVTYTYDSLNRLATATSSVNPGWGQSFGYDGFGNLTTVSVTKGSAPSLSVSYNASTNRRSGDSADSNGNIFQNGITAYDVSNRVAAANITNGTVRYTYGPGNKRIWRGTWVSGSQTVDELTFYSAGGAKLCSYNLTTSGSDLRAAGTGYYEYFGGKLIKNAGGYVGQDRLGSIGKFFPYGQERPSATANGKEKFATYFRDSETGLDYAQNRYHSAGDGRFLSADPYEASAGPEDPGSWNRYSYVLGDPVNHFDPAGLQCKLPNGEPCPPAKPAPPRIPNELPGMPRFGPIEDSPCVANPELDFCLTPLTIEGALERHREFLAQGVTDQLWGDCQALVGYAEFAASLTKERGLSAGTFVSMFGMLTPEDGITLAGVNFSGVARAAGIYSFAGDTRLNRTNEQSTFAGFYRDSVPGGQTGDQAHHFSFYFQLGHKFGASAAMGIGWGMDLKNEGDQRLAYAAAALGSWIKDSKDVSGAVSRIKDLCAD